MRKIILGILISAAVFAGGVGLLRHTPAFGDTIGTLDKWIYDTTNVLSPRGGNSVKVLVGATSSGSADVLQVTGGAKVDNLTISGTCTGCSGGISDPGSNGILSRTALNTVSARTITGTTNRLTVTNGDGVSGNPTIDISASYVGQSSITTLGTITTGVWNGTAIGASYLTAMTSTVGGAVPTPPNNTTTFLRGDGTFAVPSGGSGTVTSVSVATANGFSGTVANATTTPAITIIAGAITPTSVNGLTITANGTNTLNIAAGKTLVVSNNLTLAGTDGTTMTFPTTSATIARTDAANTFTGHQTIEGVTSTGATGTGKLVFDGSPTLVTPTLGVASATTINKVTLTTPATGSTLTLIDGKTLTVNKTISLTAADDTGVYTLPTGTKTLVATDVATLSSLTSVGTIGTGTWQGTAIGTTYGGTGIDTHLSTGVPSISSGTWSVNSLLPLSLGGTNGNLTASNGGIFYSTASAGAILSGTATAGQILRSGASAAPTWSTATYPATAGTSGNILTSDGTNWTSAAPAAATVVPPMVIASTLNTSGDINQVSAPTNATFTNGSGSGSAQIATTTTSGSFGRWGWNMMPSNPTIYTAGFSGTAFIYVRCAVASTGDFFIGFGSPGATAASLDYATQNHMGFKFIANGSQLTMTPTVSDGTETAGSAVNISNDNKIALKWVYTSSVAADFYYSVNGAAYTKVTLTTHIPTGTEGNFGFSITNKNTATQVNYDIRGISLQF